MKKIKTIDGVAAYNFLKSATLGNMETSQKFNIIKNLRPLRKVAEAFDEFRQDAIERLKGEDVKEMEKRNLSMQKNGATPTPEEKLISDAVFETYEKEVNDCVREYAETEIEVDICPINEDTFGQLMSANEKWTIEQTMAVQDMLC